MIGSQEVRDKYGAVVKMIDSGDKLKLDQNHVETVIPAPGTLPDNLRFLRTDGALLGLHHLSCTLCPPQRLVVELPAGKRVLILNGVHRNTEALLEGIDEKKFCATLTLESVSTSSLRPCCRQSNTLKRAEGLKYSPIICSSLKVDVINFIRFIASHLLQLCFITHLCLQGQQRGKRVDVAYEDFSKLA